MNISRNSVIQAVLMCRDSIRLFYTNPVLWVYPLLPALLSAPRSLFAWFERPLTSMLLMIVIIIGRFCLSHHSMHLLRQQPSSIYESCKAIVQRYIQVLCWVTLEIAYIITLLQLHSVQYPFNTFFFLLAIVSFLTIGTSVMIPALATRGTSLTTAIKQVTNIVWNNFTLYILIQVILLSASLLSALGLHLVFRIVSHLASVHSHAYVWAATYIILAVFLLPLLTIANTIFYYQFHVKRELELQEIFFTTQA